MKVHLDAPKPSVTETGERVEKMGPVIFFGKEEGMLGRPSVCISETLSEPRVAVDPRSDALSFDVAVRCAVRGFKVIGDAEEDVDRAAMATMTKEPLESRIQ
jgi:hypothetical protein